MTKTPTTDALKIKWRGHPTEMTARGKAPGLRYEISIHNLRGSQGFGIYYGGSLRETHVPPLATDANGRQYYDHAAGYEYAKARAQELAATWAAADAATDKAREERQAAERAATEAWAKQRADYDITKAEALKLAAEIDESYSVMTDSDGNEIGEPRPTESEAARRLAALVKKLLV